MVLKIFGNPLTKLRKPLSTDGNPLIDQWAEPIFMANYHSRHGKHQINIVAIKLHVLNFVIGCNFHDLINIQMQIEVLDSHWLHS